MGMPPAGGGAPWRSFCGTGRCLPLVSSLVPLTPITHLKRLRLVGWYDTQTGTDSPHCAQVWDACVHDCLQCPEAVDGGVTNAPQVSHPAWRRRPQSLWAREWRSQVVAGPVRGATNGAAFIVGVRADRRSSAPSVLPFFVLSVGLVCSVGCPRGCSNSLMLRRCGIIWMVPAVLPTGRPAGTTLWASCFR